MEKILIFLSLIMLFLMGCTQYNLSGFEDQNGTIVNYVDYDVNVSSNLDVKKNISIEEDIVSNGSITIFLGE